MHREWTPEQLKRWRIRKVQNGEQTPWQRRDWSALPDDVLTASPQWCIWRPWEQHPIACVDTQQDAIRHVILQLQSAYLRAAEREELERQGMELARINNRPRGLES